MPLKPGVQDAPVGGQVTALSAEEYFNRLNALLVDNPPEPSDPELMRRIAALGVATRRDVQHGRVRRRDARRHRRRA